LRQLSRLSFRGLLGSVALLIGFAAEVSAATVPDACTALRRQIDAMPAGPVWLASYPDAQPGPLKNVAFLYDNAVAAIALVGCGHRHQARRIGDAILAALERDRFWHDGRLRNGYAAGPIADGPLKLAGWWDSDQNRWVEDRYQVGSDSGNLAWAMLALLSLDRESDGAVYTAGAQRIGRWVTSRLDRNPAAGFSGGMFGHEPTPETVTWTSTEHNTDLAAAFALLAKRSGDPAWLVQSQKAAAMVKAMWDDSCRCYAAGISEDGKSRNPFLALDAQIWPLLAIYGAPGLDTQLPGEARLKFKNGFAYSEAGNGIWTEGTAQAALLAELRGATDRAARLRDAILAQRSADGGYYATSTGDLPTGFMLPTVPDKPRLYFHIPHLGALAWVALAERHFNPFTASNRLPGPESAEKAPP